MNKQIKMASVFFLFLVVLVYLQNRCSALAVGVTVSAGKAVYNIDEDVYVYGNVKADGAPVANATVALEVRDPAASPAIVRTLSTNSSGVYSLSFKLPYEASAGTYTVNVTCNYGGGRATNVTSFVLEKYFPLVVEVNMGRSTYEAGETIVIFGNVTRGGVPVSNVFVAIEVQDPKSSPIVIRVVGTDSSGLYTLTFQLSSSAPLGTYIVNASASFGDQDGADDTSFRFVQQMVADINGDGKVNILDIALVAQAWGSYPGHPRWNPKCDLDGNSMVNIIDIALVAREYRA